MGGIRLMTSGPIIFLFLESRLSIMIRFFSFTPLNDFYSSVDSLSAATSAQGSATGEALSLQPPITCLFNTSLQSVDLKMLVRYILLR